MAEDELKDWRKHNCILEVDLEYPKELHDAHNEYPCHAGYFFNSCGER